MAFCQITLTTWQNTFRFRRYSEFAVNSLLKFPLHLACVATLPCEIFSTKGSGFCTILYIQVKFLHTSVFVTFSVGET